MPNFVPAACASSSSDASNKPNAVSFAFIGNFAVGRGIKELIEAWDFDPSVATLSLIGPDNPFKSECIRLSKKLSRGQEA